MVFSSIRTCSLHTGTHNKNRRCSLAFVPVACQRKQAPKKTVLPSIRSCSLQTGTHNKNRKCSLASVPVVCEREQAPKIDGDLWLSLSGCRTRTRIENKRCSLAREQAPKIHGALQHSFLCLSNMRIYKDLCERQQIYADVY